MVLLNQGDFNFSLIKPSKADELYKNLGNIQFESSIKKNSKVIFEGVDQFTKFEFGIPLNNSGALLVGFKDLNAILLDDKKLNIRTHIKYGDIDFSTSICFQYHPGPEFMAARTSFKRMTGVD